MASSSAATPDTPIALKINFDGATRRFKLPLRELGVATLEDKLRGFLHIAHGVKTVVERYSDSAAAYVVLDSANPSIYKQLFRAAKAKQKLKLRVSVVVPPQLEDVARPKPVTVEDELETNDAAEAEPVVTEALVEQSASLDKSLPVDSRQYQFSQTASALPSDILCRYLSSMASAEPKESEEQAQVPTTTSEQPVIPECPALASRLRRPFTVCCNSCDRAVPDAHFHCSACDDGDFDLCQDCVNQGISCYNDQHWLIKRTIADGQITYSTTHVAPKINRTSQDKPAQEPASACLQPRLNLPIRPIEPVVRSNAGELSPWAAPLFMARTCNSCVQEFPEKEFLHCNVCDDFDLCKACFNKDQHGHHPKHSFAPAVNGTMFDASIMARLNAGRNVRHNAICDGCNHYIRGIRHKCLDCPDWDYCSDCAQNAGFIHPNHRFAPIFEPLAEPARVMSRSIHNGICCDGPLCTSSRTGSRYIVGVRYKCAVCHDTDFCAGCEASPANTHNKTHPLIKFRTAVRHVSVTTTGEHQDGERLPPMGDRQMSVVPSRHTSNRSTETVPSPSENIAVNPVQTVIDVKPTEAPVEPIIEKVVEKVVEKDVIEPEQTVTVEKTEEAVSEPDLIAVFKRDTIEDGTAMPPNHTFEQTWVLRNEGKAAWPAGCSVKFVGGDYMGAVDPTRPTGVRELISASESTICYNQLQPGQEFPFTVLMRTPDREGKVISYWRLTSCDGVKFGHKLWCDVTVEAPIKEVEEEQSLLDTEVPEMARSRMIIPKLDHESPSASVLVPKDESEFEVATETDTLALSTRADDEEYEDCAEDDDWAESDGGFMTDEEYDILDASDEEYLFDQQKIVSKK
ncbi:hypothetical protein BKA67DRAFT_516366 [Truncatella angustata]|uniref:ZZ-type domain-containing protein n=1 Tax=Truncatella angustata TaxID=152316 RepID=A0A9P8ZZ59_9PEZI|nr:uncharacterized protein BKA67DRAFT_516366 [Truncatella angustata]KAH6655733.1 hypothetical protein BKA67DRAFT_516366 [Truncatella angustata]